jgi:Domain of unknown function (DUF5615)
LKIILQADASLDPDVVRGLRRREPSIDFQNAAGIIPDGTPDPEVLRVAADAGRILVTADVRTMMVHLARFIEQRESPGVLLITSARSIGEAIEGFLVLWLTLTPADLRNQARWIP